MKIALKIAFKIGIALKIALQFALNHFIIALKTTLKSLQSHSHGFF